jgi:hypothetical protein
VCVIATLLVATIDLTLSISFVTLLIKPLMKFLEYSMDHGDTKDGAIVFQSNERISKQKGMF